MMAPVKVSILLNHCDLECRPPQKQNPSLRFVAQFTLVLLLIRILFRKEGEYSQGVRTPKGSEQCCVVHVVGVTCVTVQKRSLIPRRTCGLYCRLVCESLQRIIWQPGGEIVDEVPICADNFSGPNLQLGADPCTVIDRLPGTDQEMFSAKSFDLAAEEQAELHTLDAYCPFLNNCTILCKRYQVDSPIFIHAI